MTLGVRGRRGALRSRGSDAGSARAGVASCLARTRRPGLRPAVARRLPTSPPGTRPALLRACPASRTFSTPPTPPRAFSPSSSKKHTSRDSAERRSGPVRASVLGRGLPLRRHLFLRQRSRGGRDVNASALPPRDRGVENAPAAAGRLRPRLRVSPPRLSPAFASFGSDASKKSVCVRSLSACRSSSWRPQSFYPPPPPALSASTLPHARPSGPPRSCTALPSFWPSGRGRPGPSCWRRSGPDSRARPRSPVFAPSGCPAAAGGCSQVRVLPPHIRMQLRLHACMHVVVQTRLQLRTHARAHACVTHAPEQPERSADETACPCVVRMLTFSFFRLSRL